MPSASQLYASHQLLVDHQYSLVNVLHGLRVVDQVRSINSRTEGGELNGAIRVGTDVSDGE